MRTHPAAAHYRPDIDGLRAIAVMGVVLYHADARLIPGGFVGVDVFFVISGFLITTILLKQMNEGTLSIKTFYERRIRRIMPALFAMMGLVLLFGIWRMTPWDLKELAGSAKYAVCSVANLFFHRVTAGYFAESVDNMPLLHTWSLGVEEQFYVFFPLILMAAMRLGWARRYIGWLLGGACALSLGLCVWKMQTNSSDCFYLLPYRAWELTIGALLAFHLPKWTTWGADVRPKQLATIVSHGLGIIGLLLIIGAMAFVGKTTPFPGVAALAPCLGAAMLIAAGARGHHWVGRLLALRPVVLIGLISYSVYLWHWPMLVFQHYLNILHPENLSLGFRLGMALAALPVGYLSWRFIEQPFRGNRFKGWPLFAGWGGISLLFIACTFAIERSNGFETRIPERAKCFLAYKTAPHTASAPFVPNLPPTDNEIYGDTSQPPHFVLWGDSHGEALREGLGEVARAHGASFRFYGRGGNGPIVGMRKLKPAWPGGNSPEKDEEYNAQVLERITADKTIQGVILIARWSGYTEGDPGETRESIEQVRIGHQDGSPFTNIQEARQDFAGHIRETVAKLRAAGKTVFLIYPVPELPFNAINTLSREILIGHNVDRIEVPAQHLFFERQAFAMGVLDSIPDGPDLIRIKPHTLLIEKGHIHFMDGNKLFYSDSNHLSVDGVRQLRPLLDPIFNQPSPASAAAKDSSIR